MGKVYRIYQVDAFTKEKLSGNPAGVVPNADGLTEPQMQKIARELNNSETAFIFQPSDATHDVRVRFFTPTREVPICGHATVAAHYVRAVEGGLGAGRVLQKTGVGILPVDTLDADGDYRIVMTQGAISIGAPLMESHIQSLAGALGLRREDMRADCPVVIASTGHSKVMAGIRDVNLLHGLKPDMTELSRLSNVISCNGYYVFTLHPGEAPLVHGRMFAPAIGINEDPVTGNANGPLGAYLVHFGLVRPEKGLFTFEAAQGEAIGRAGRMEVSVQVKDGEPEQARIAGDAVIAFTTTLELDS
jgi:PhzF family phenazine biosynthesis protein